MIREEYKKQVSLLLSVLPEIAKERCFALHGGTAINLFVRQMPRLSVDIDLTYLPLDSREVALNNITKSLEEIKNRIERFYSQIKVDGPNVDGKMFVSLGGVSITIEVNLIKRGCYDPPVDMLLCKSAQDMFDAFCAIQIVTPAHLFGGKICAALDRQHPRDLFDSKYILDELVFDKELKKGFIFYLVSGNRPLVELLFPKMIDQSKVFERSFEGMTNVEFSYDDFLSVRERLVRSVQKSLNKNDVEFLLSLKRGEPDWSIYDFREFPAVKWKLQNINISRETNPMKHLAMYNNLEGKLYDMLELRLD